MALTEKQQKQFNTVCGRIAEGESLRAACNGKNGAVKGTSSFYDMRDNHDKDGRLAAQYARAREERADFHADEIVEISDDESLDPNSRRIKVDARKWVASKLRPQAYGDRIDHKHSGSLTIGIKRNERIDGD